MPIKPEVAPASEGIATVDELLRVEDLSVHFGRRRLGGAAFGKVVRAVDGVSLAIGRGETVGVAGESGSGKTTLGRAILHAVSATAGRIVFDGVDVTNVRGDALRQLRRRIQIVPQDTFGSLDPRMQVWKSVAEPIRAHGLMRDSGQVKQRVAELFDLCGLPDAVWSRYPQSLSGGQRQRVSIARALAVEPDLLVADEPTSALDVLVQAQILDLFRSLQQRTGISYLFISHNLHVLAALADRVAIMYAGELVEVGPARAVLSDPIHPYSEALVRALPTVTIPERGARRLSAISGEPPDPTAMPSGCRFHGRCPLVEPRCTEHHPELEVKRPDRSARCFVR